MLLAGYLPGQTTFTWNSGDLLTVLSPTTVNAGDTLNVATGSNHDLRFETLTNNGTINWTAGYLRGGDGSVILNTSVGTFNDQNSAGYTVHNPYGSGTFIFTNEGTYVRNVAGTTSFSIPFNNSGTINLQQGDIQFQGGGTLSSSGSMTAASGTTFWFTNGYTIESASSLSGAGTYRLSGGTLTAAGTINVGNFLQTGGTLAGTQTFGSGTFTWNGGVWDAASAGPATTIGSSATLNIATGSNHDFRYRTITNQGTVNWSSGYIRGGDGSTFTNASGATFNDQNSSSYTVHNPYGSGTFIFTNEGTYVRNVTGTTYYDIPFNNSGTVNLQQGDLQFRAGGTLSSSGSIAAASGTTVLFTNGYTIESASSLSGAGSFQLSGGTLTADGTVNVGNFLQTGGTLAGTQTFGSGTFTWNAGVWDAASAGPTTTIASGAVLEIATGSNHDFRRRSVTNQGTVNWSSGYIRGGDGSTFTNASGATFNDQNASSYTVSNPYGSGTFIFTNEGAYVRNVAGTTYYDIPFNNTGTVSLQQGDIQFRSGGTLSSTGSIVAATGTNVWFTNGYTIESASSLSGAGTFQLSGGTLTADGTVNVGNFLQSGGTLAGTQTFGSGTFTWNGGVWDASATGPATTIGSGATLNLATGSNHDFRRRVVTNQGTVNWSSGYIRGGDGSTFTNASGATFNDQNSSSYTVHNPYGSGTFIFTNEGTYVRNVTGTTYYDIPFNNTGTVSLQQGDLQFRGGGTLASTGSITAATSTNVWFTNNYTIQSAASLAGTGTYRLTGGTLTIDGTVGVGNFIQTGGTLAGTQTFSSGTFTWDGGVWDASAAGPSTTIGSSATLNLATGSNHDFRRRMITNQGTVNWSSGYIRGGDVSTFTNASGATFNDQNSSSYTVHNPYGSGSFTFTNEGTYVRNVAGTTYFDVPFANGGTLQLKLGELQLRSTATLDNTSRLEFTLAGPTTRTDYGLLSVSASLALAGEFHVTFGGGFQESATAGQTFTFVSAGSLSGAFSNITNGGRLTTTDGLGSFVVNYGSGSAFAVNSVVLSDFVAVPEPSTWALLILGGTALALAARRRA